MTNSFIDSIKQGGVRAVLRGDEPSLAGDHGGPGREPGSRPQPLPELLRGERLHNAAQLLPALPASLRDSRDRPALRPDVADHPPPGRRRRAAGARGRAVARHRAAAGRLRRQHRGHLHGALQWPLQELPPQGRGEQQGAPQVAGFLPLPGDGQDSGAAGEARRRGEPQGLPGFHVARVARLHAEALPGGHEDLGGVLRVGASAAEAEAARVVKIGGRKKTTLFFSALLVSIDSFLNL